MTVPQKIIIPPPAICKVLGAQSRRSAESKFRINESGAGIQNKCDACIQSFPNCFNSCGSI